MQKLCNSKSFEIIQSYIYNSYIGGGRGEGGLGARKKCPPPHFFGHYKMAPYYY